MSVGVRRGGLHKFILVLGKGVVICEWPMRRTEELVKES